MEGCKRLFLILAAIFVVGPVWAGDEVVRIYAAGSLKAAFGEVARKFEAQQGIPVRFEFGPSGLLRDRLVKGEEADVFASANMEHPQALQDKGLAGPVQRFARNNLCALAAPGVSVTSDSLLDRMLDPAIKLGISTPKADPSGDYALELFNRAERRLTGARDRLAAKALQLTGGPNSPQPPKDRSLYGKLLEEGAADIFLTYCTNALIAHKELPSEQVVQIPPALNVGADYGLTILKSASDAAQRFVTFLLSDEGQAILASQGFSKGMGN